MKTVVYRCAELDTQGSWRPRSLTDLRGPRFPEQYEIACTFNASTIEESCRIYDAATGDVIFMGEGDELVAYVVAPFGWEQVKFGANVRSL